MNDPFPTDPFPTAPRPAAVDLSEQDQRQTLIREYRKASLQQPDLIRANLGAIHSELMEVSVALKQSVDRQLADGGDSGRASDELFRTIEMYLRVHRQLDRYLQLDVRLSGGPTRSR